MAAHWWGPPSIFIKTSIYVYLKTRVAVQAPIIWHLHLMEPCVHSVRRVAPRSVRRRHGHMGASRHPPQARPPPPPPPRRQGPRQARSQGGVWATPPLHVPGGHDVTRVSPRAMPPSSEGGTALGREAGVSGGRDPACHSTPSLRGMRPTPVPLPAHP